MELNAAVIILNDLIVAVAFFIIGFYLSEYKSWKKSRQTSVKTPPKPQRKKKSAEVDRFSGLPHETIMEEIRSMRSKK